MCSPSGLQCARDIPEQDGEGASSTSPEAIPITTRGSSCFEHRESSLALTGTELQLGTALQGHTTVLP